MEIQMKKPNLFWKLSFKTRMKHAMEQGYKILNWRGNLTPAQIRWIENEYHDFMVSEDEMDESGLHYTIFFGKPKNVWEALEYLN